MNSDASVASAFWVAAWASMPVVSISWARYHARLSASLRRSCSCVASSGTCRRTLVIQARATYLYEEELQTITLTGVIRSEDISQDNSILSDRIYSLDMQTTNEGAVRDTTKRGFIPRIFDAFKPF